MSQRPRHILTSSDEETEANPEVEVVAAETSGQKTPIKTPKKTPTPAPLSVKKKRALDEAEADTETPKSKKSKTSKISKRNILLWKHFETTKDPNVVICIANPACRAKIRRPDGATSGMRSHFAAKHPVQYAQYVKDENEALLEKVCSPEFDKYLTNNVVILQILSMLNEYLFGQVM
jgi:hypothetical protein